MRKGKVIITRTPSNPDGLHPDWVQREFEKSKTTVRFGAVIDETMTVFSKEYEVKELKITMGNRDKGKREIKKPKKAKDNA